MSRALRHNMNGRNASIRWLKSLPVTFSNAKLRTRIAPTPSGFLHWGNAFSFVLTWLVARKYGGLILLRIDDLDATRKRPEYVEDIFRGIDWLGLDYDEGPKGPDDFEARHSQHHRLDLYFEKLAQLRCNNQLFGCRCSRTSIKRDSTNRLHPSSCHKQQLELDDTNTAWRIVTASTPTIEWLDTDDSHHQIDLHQSMRDFIVRKKNQMPAYQVASLSDDLHYDINLVVRGEDLIHSTAAQRWLAAQTSNGDNFMNASFMHHSIVTDEQDEKLSKSSGASSLRSLQANNATSAKLYRKLSPLLGLPQAVNTAEEALALWTPS